jgi:hypothetical protein
MCWFEGTRPPGSTIYYPVHKEDTDLLNLPLRNQLSKFAREICRLGSESAKKEAGIKGLSFLLKLPFESAQYTGAQKFINSAVSDQLKAIFFGLALAFYFFYFFSLFALRVRAWLLLPFRYQPFHDNTMSDTLRVN